MSGPVSPDLRFKAQWRGRSGEVSKTLSIDPLGGLYAPSAWREGELIKIESIERLTPSQAQSAALVIERRGRAAELIPVTWRAEAR